MFPHADCKSPLRKQHFNVSPLYFRPLESFAGNSILRAIFQTRLQARKILCRNVAYTRMIDKRTPRSYSSLSFTGIVTYQYRCHCPRQKGLNLSLLTFIGGDKLTSAASLNSKLNARYPYRECAIVSNLPPTMSLSVKRYLKG